jgi:hypothetical protein
METARWRRRAGAACLTVMAITQITACAHPHRVSQREVRQLTNKGTPFVLVFGSLATPAGRPGRPVIRFVYQKDRPHAEYLLASLTLSTDQRFHAILRAPKDTGQAIPYLDHFNIEIGSAETGFDRVLYVHLQRPEAPLAMYVGDIRIVPAQNRGAGGEKVNTSVIDNFREATLELRRLYPQFEGTLRDEARLLPRASVDVPPLERVR